MKFLSIIIPQYKEGNKKISILLNSIDKQKKIDFSSIEVIIVNDASNIKLSKSTLTGYNFEIKYYKNEINVGPGVTRQNGIDLAIGKYVMFIDADDKLFDELSLYYPISYLKETDYNVLLTNIVIETENYELAVRSGNSVHQYLHGKFIKRSYLIDNNIKFHPTLRNFEDSYFTTLLLSRMDFHSINYNTYLRCYIVKVLLKLIK